MCALLATSAFSQELFTLENCRDTVTLVGQADLPNRLYWNSDIAVYQAANICTGIYGSSLVPLEDGEEVETVATYSAKQLQAITALTSITALFTVMGFAYGIAKSD